MVLLRSYNRSNISLQRGIILRICVNVYYRISLVTHGQDFSHMYAQPTIIHVQAEEEDDKGIEVRSSTVPDKIY